VYTGPGGLGDGTRFRTLDPGATPATAAGDNRDHGLGGKKVHRQHFTMTETVPLLFGLIKSHVRLMGTYCWVDLEEGATSAYTVYESIADGIGLTIRKLRFLEEVEVDVGEGKEKVKGTRVTERIEGWAPALARPVAQYVCAEVHRSVLLFFSFRSILILVCHTQGANGKISYTLSEKWRPCRIIIILNENYRISLKGFLYRTLPSAIGESSLSASV